MTYEDILRDAAARKFAPVYVLHGEEPFFIDRIEATIEKHALTESEKSFNQTVLYGKDIDHLSLLDHLRRYPMMAERQVVILREAQDMKSLGELAAYAENPSPTTLFVICHKHKKIDMRSKLGKNLSANRSAIVFESKKLYENQMADWIASYAKSQKLRLEPDAADLLAEYLGVELHKAANEIDKLALNLSPGATVNAQLVQQHVGISKDYNVFELQRAIAARDLPRVARIEQYFTANIKRNPLIVTVGSLFNFFSKVYVLHFMKGASEGEMVRALDLRSEWFLKDYKLALHHYSLPKTIQIIHHLSEYDLRSKGVDTDLVSTPEEALMRELFWKILH